MNNTITAIGIKEIYEELLKEKEINIINSDILYKEGILEILEKKEKINYIIINKKIPGEIEINKLLNKIYEINKEIKIILIIEKSEIEKIENKNNIIIIKNKINYLEILKEIKNNILDKKIEKNNIEIKQENNMKINDKIKIYSIEGTRGSGKSIISSILAYQISRENKKILLIDFDTKTGNIHTIFQLKKEINKIQKINNNLFFINLEKENLKINLFTEDYDFIILDNYNEKELKINNKKIYLLEGNLIEIEKMKNYKNKITNNNYIIINKYNKNSIDNKILEKILENKKIFKIKYSDKYNSIINNFKIIKENKYFKKEYKEIVNEIIQN